jgi:hypothetical protein
MKWEAIEDIWSFINFYLEVVKMLVLGILENFK